jgi:hypothetical protein
MTNEQRAELYRLIFVADDDGKRVLEDLSTRFYDRKIYVPGGPEGARATDFNAGQQSVIHYILQVLTYVKPEDRTND